MTDRDKAVELLARAIETFCIDVMGDYDVMNYIPSNDPEFCSACKTEATALIPQIAPLLTAVKVKPLVWVVHPVGLVAGSYSGGSSYMIDTRGKRPTIMKGLTFAQQFDTLEAAKAAAQADYEARILSAVDAVPVAQAVEAERIACNEELRLAVAAARAEERKKWK